ncbi:hemagglutinin repeat-containing protein [Agrobacterium leguminum]|uniref:hemagglutinin repeat-containing protein n=1 Tax=Agrobacterium leguminum TaxID=2792015 RepID=UPI0022B828BF|nr:hemagglutinin repeat-containing protein [Agrobacterium leguminum]MCZ7932225.1 hemagglutinin repeat-containing protein [Agrobacterium leguminum]
MTSQFKYLSHKATETVLFAHAGALIRKIIATVVSCTLVLQPVLLHAQDITPETGGSAINRPGIGVAPNGAPLIDIVGPNSQGLSHNKYDNFNVGTPGVILNNFNGEVGTSKLGGVTPGNPNLQGKSPASVILNEVTSQNRSSLVGPTEVFGGRADVIIANPNGITCDGCGFINTPRATLTTGVPDIGTDGRLTGFTVNNGDVTFGSKGANFASGDGTVDLFDIVSRTIQIDGTIYGEDLRLTAGQGKFDYTTGEATPLAATSGTPEYAIDGSAFGAMQAGRIKMVVTEKGAGVRMRGDMAANTGELSLSADGKISIGSASGNKGVSVSSKGSVSTGRLTSKKSVSVKAGKDVNIASIGAEEAILINGGAGFVDVVGTLGAGSAITILGDGRVAVADVSAAGPVSLWSGAGSIGISGTAQSGAAMSISAASGSIAAGTFLSKGDLALLSGLDLGISGLVLAEQNLQASAGGNIRYGSLEANGNVSLSSAGGVISLDKRTAAGGDIRIRQQHADLSNNRSGLATSGTLYIDANNINLANSTLTFGGIDLTSSGATDLTGTRLNAVASNSTSRFAQVPGDIAIAADSLVANGATNLLAARDLTLTLPQLVNAGQLAAGNDLTFNVTGNLTNAATGLIYAGNDAALFVGGVLANEQGAIVAGHDLTIAGNAHGGRNAAIVNSSGFISAGHNMSIITANLRNERTTAPTYTTQFLSNALVSAYDIYYARECGDCSSPIEFYNRSFVIGSPIHRVYRDVIEDRLISSGSPAALIKAGNTLSVDTVDLTNAYSAIEAGAGMTLNGSGTLTNLGLQLQRTTSLNCNQHGGCQYYPDVIYEWTETKTTGDTGGHEGSWQIAMPGPSPFGTRDTSKDIGPGRTVESVEAIGGVTATIRSGGTLGITGFAAVNNTASAGTIADHAAVATPQPSSDPTALLAGVTASGALFTLGAVATPQSGGFGGTVPGQTFLYETRAAFLDVSKFYGSSYFLGRISYQPDRQIQFLGDAYFENQYIEQQLRLATGSGFTGQDSITQIKQLLDNGAAYLGANQRQFGEPLTAEEIASLTESVVVYEWQTVNGTSVLAPVLHLAANDRERLNSAGALIAGNQVTIDTGLLATSGMIASTGDLTVSGSSIAAIGGAFSAGGNASIKGDEGILLANAKVTAGGNLGLTSNGDINISVTERSTTSTLRDKRSTTTVVRTTSQGSEITAGGSVTANAGGSLNVIGSAIAADGTVGLKATGDVTIAEAVDTTTIDYTYKKKGGLFGGKKQTTSHTETETAVGSSVSGGKGVSITSGGDTVVSASKVMAGDETNKADINVSAGGDLLIASGKNTAEFEQSSSSKGFLSKKSSTQYNYDEATVGSELSASGNVKLDSAGNTVIAGSTITAGDAISVTGDSVAIIGAEEQHALESSSKKSGLFAGSGGGFLSLWGKEQKEKSQSSTLNVGSALTAGTDVTLTARENDVNVIGSSIMAGRDITLEAARDVNITPGAESAASAEKEQRSGFGLSFSSGSGSASVGIGYGKSVDQTSQSAETNAKSTLSAGRDLTISAGRDANLQAAEVSAERDAAILAERNVNLLSAQDKSNYEHMHEEMFAGVSLSVSSGLASAAGSLANAAGKLGGPNGAYALAPAALAAYRVKDILKQIDDGAQPLASASLSVGFTYQKSNATLSTFTPVVTTIEAGDSVSIVANSGDLTGRGVQIAAGSQNDPTSGNVLLMAGGSILLESAQSASSSSSSSRSANASIGVNLASGGLSGGFAAGSGKQDANSVTHLNTHVMGTGNVTLASGNDTTLAGAVVSGDRVTVAVGGDLNIVSRQDTMVYDEKTAGGGLNLSSAGKVGGGVQKSDVEGNYANVSEQSGLIAGSGGYNVKVGGNVGLVGGVIGSTADPAQNTLSANSLTWSDITNRSEASSSSLGISLTPGGIPVPVVGQPAKEEDQGVARATLTPGQLTLTNQTQDLAALNTDLSKSNTTADPFDIERLKAKQESAAALSALANIAVGDISAKLGFAEGSPAKIALHAAVGGLVAQLAGGNAGSGALAGGLSEVVNGVLQQVLSANPNLTDDQKSAITQWVAAIVGAAVGGETGAAAGLDNVNYNFLTHKQSEDLAKELKGCDSVGDPAACKAAVSDKYSQIDFDQDRQLDACRTRQCVQELLGDLNDDPRFAYLDVMRLQELGVSESLAQRLLSYQVMERWLTGDSTVFEQKIMDVASGVGYCEDHGQSSGCFAKGQALKYVSATVTEIAYGAIGLRSGIGTPHGGANGATRPPAINPTPQQLASAERLGVDPRWVKANGEIDWPKNHGFSEPPTILELQPGVRFDRYGGKFLDGEFRDPGAFASPTGVPFGQRALPNSSLNDPYTTYEIVLPIPGVNSGIAAPWFGQPGGGVQYQLPFSIDYLIRNGFIVVIK